MQTEKLYEETIFLWVFAAILSAFTSVFLFIVVYQILVGSLGDNPAPNRLFAFMALLFLGITINFSRLSIKMTSRSAIVGYGICKRTIPWEDIGRCYVDEASTIRHGRVGYTHRTS